MPAPVDDSSSSDDDDSGLPDAKDMTGWMALAEFAGKELTPLEQDLQLRVEQMMYLSLITGDRGGLMCAKNLWNWQTGDMSQSWVERNHRQRKKVWKRMRRSGENTPMWKEGFARAGDLAWEVFAEGKFGERLKTYQEVDRDGVLAQLVKLWPMLRCSFFARCGFGAEPFTGLRALIAILHLFAHDGQVLNVCLTCLRGAMWKCQKNITALAQLTVPIPPMERCSKRFDKGWSFIRQALRAMVVQMGRTDPYDETLKGEEPKDAWIDTQVALHLVLCILDCWNAEPLHMQMRLLKEELPPRACRERIGLKLLMPFAWSALKEIRASGVVNDVSRGFLGQHDDPMNKLRSLMMLAAPPGVLTSSKEGG